MKQRTMKRVARKGLAIVLALGINLLPLQGLIPVAHASGGLNIPTKDQPQVLIILDNSQGMAGVIKGPDGLSGAIMSGSGTVPEDANSSSPINYTASSGFTPPAQGSGGQTVPYSVACNSGSLSKLGQEACTKFGASGSSAYVDNSESMFNVAENAIRSILNTPNYSNNIQFGLMDYGTSQPPEGQPWVYNTWVYYMSGENGFSFGRKASDAPQGEIAVPNPCYGSVNQNGYFTNNSCANIYFMSQHWYNQGYGGNRVQSGANLSVSGLYNDPWLFIADTSDNPIINDVLYSTSSGSGSGDANIVSAYGPYFNQGQGLNLQNYESQNVLSFYYNNSNSNFGESSPTSAGYIPLSPQVWNSQRGLAFNSNITYRGSIVSAINQSNAQNAESIKKAIVPEVLSTNLSFRSKPITASAGYAPVAGAFSTAANYYSSTAKNSTSHPPSTCGKKYVIFITFGQPTAGKNGNVYPPLGSASANIVGITPITAAMVSATTPNNNGISTNNYAVVEAVNQVKNLYNNDGVKTYVLGVGSAVNPNLPGTTPAQQAVAQQGQYVLQALANAGGTNTVYSATTASGVTAALNNIVSQILGKSVVSSYAAPPTVVPGSLEFLLKNINPVTGQGDLFAYPVTPTGAVSSSASWTANQIMNPTNRTDRLYTTPLGGSNNGGAPQTFSSVASTNSAAFAITTTNLTASDIANYTINPSYGSGTYLGGRQSGWYVGLPANLVPAQVLVPPSSASLLNNPGYLAFAGSHASRQNAVLFADNDGFLYALGYNNTGSPTLLWGWMPGGLLSSLQNYQTFWQGNNMGGFSTIDVYDSSSSSHAWHTYVVGTANNGTAEIIYDLQLGGTSAPSLQKVVSQYDLTGYTQTQTSAPVFYQVQSSSGSKLPVGTTWALFALNSSSGSYLGVLNVGTGASYLDPLPFTNTATPYIDASGNLFLGDSSGNVYEMSNSELLSVLTAKNTVTNLSISNDFTEIGNYAKEFSTALQTNVQFIGGTYYQGANYLRVQGPSGITLFKQINNVWSPVWTAYAGGAGSWSGGTYTAQSGSVTSNSISPLPPGSTISDQALISGGNVIVPVTVPAPAKSCGSSTAVYYIYGLSNGVFPSGAFVSSSGTAITQGFIIGRGSAYTPSVSTFNGHVLLQSAASQNSSGKTSGFATVFGAGLPLGGPVAWRLVLTQ
ncbi:MAG: type IV pilin biogenesis protein [Acidithiobacillus sp.]